MAQQFSLGQRLVLSILSVVGPLLIRLYGASWRIRWEGQENLEKAKSRCGHVLFCCWHSRLLGLCYTHRFRNIGIMISKSFDGEWVARVAQRLGYKVFRGSGSKDGAVALAEMLKDRSSEDLALTVDGPRGPAEEVKPGVILLASKTGLPIVPITFTSTSLWRLKSWDRFIVPKPFATITVKYGDWMIVSKDIDAGKIRDISAELENTLSRIG